ncbi:YecA family protein [Helicovermis profundi]|uniref:SEC-C motif-containing protein n=1 Tax=Helicovermis profundi TaxID=3065157 RepID=A0AAU9E9Z4_9FIRM|nr:hypothetical protein HLPR_26590 [Clostridia bacterium S502]
MNQLTEYIIALSNLYGLVHKDKVMDIFNRQNEYQITLSDVEEFLDNPLKELKNVFICSHQDYFVHEAILENNEFELLLKKKDDKPYYVPVKDELLKYVDESYFEKSKEYNNLLSYLQKNFFKGDEEKAEWICEDIHGFCEFGLDMQTILDAFIGRNITFKDMNQINEVIQLVMELSNNIRIWENNGYTPKEIFEKFEKPNLKSLPDKPFSVKKNKIGRNDPCPCGSGKKYKKCCLGKE